MGVTTTGSFGDEANPAFPTEGRRQVRVATSESTDRASGRTQESTVTA